MPRLYLLLNSSSTCRSHTSKISFPLSTAIKLIGPYDLSSCVRECRRVIEDICAHLLFFGIQGRLGLSLPYTQWQQFCYPSVGLFFATKTWDSILHFAFINTFLLFFSFHIWKYFLFTASSGAY